MVQYAAYNVTPTTTMPEVYYGKRRRGTAGITGIQNRVPEKPYWEDLDDDGDNNETGLKSPAKTNSAGPTDSDTNCGGLKDRARARSRRRKRPKIQSKSGSAEPKIGSTLPDDDSEIKDDADYTTLDTPALTSSVPTFQEGGASPLEPQQHHTAPDIPQPGLQVMQQLPTVERMLTEIHATLKSKFPLAVHDSASNNNRESTGGSIIDSTDDCHAKQTRSDLSFQRLESLCQQQAELLKAANAKLDKIESSRNAEIQGLAQAVGELKSTVLSFDNQQAADPASKEQMEALKLHLEESKKRESLLCEENVELSNVNKRQESMITHRDSRIQDYLVTSSRANFTYQNRITELSNAIKQSQLKVHALETENQQYKSLLASFQTSSSPDANAAAVKCKREAQQTSVRSPNFLAAARVLQEQEKKKVEGSSYSPVILTSSFLGGSEKERGHTSPSSNDKSDVSKTEDSKKPASATQKKKRSRRKEKRKSVLYSLLPSFDSLAGDRNSPKDANGKGVEVISIDDSP